MTIPERISAARLPHEFEHIALDIASDSQQPSHAALFISRLHEIDLDLPRALGEYCLRLIHSDGLIGEEIFKIFLLEESLLALQHIGVDGTSDWLTAIDQGVREQKIPRHLKKSRKRRNAKPERTAR